MTLTPLSSLLGEIEYENMLGAQATIKLTIKKEYEGTLRFVLAHDDFMKAEDSGNDVVAFDYTTTKVYDLKGPQVVSIEKVAGDDKKLKITFDSKLADTADDAMVDFNVTVVVQNATGIAFEAGSDQKVIIATYAANPSVNTAMITVPTTILDANNVGALKAQEWTCNEEGKWSSKK